MNVTRASHLFFAVTMIAIGLVGLIGGSFAPIWQPVPETVPVRAFLAYLSTLVSLASGAGMLFRRTAAPAALLLTVYLALWTALFKVPFIIRAPLVEVSYQTCGENAVLIAGSLALYGWFARDRREALPKFLGSNWDLRAAHLLYGLALVAFGFSHFAYLNLTAPLIPKWLLWPDFWAYLTGSIYLAAGLSILTGFGARLGAAISAVQIALITIVVWGPMVLAGHLSPTHFQETIVSWALTASAFVVASSYQDRAWLGRFSRQDASGDEIAAASPHGAV